MCLGPLAGAVITAAWHIPATAGGLLGIAAGILAQAAQVSVQSAFSPQRRPAALLGSAPAAALSMTAAVTAVAVHFAD